MIKETWYRFSEIVTAFGLQSEIKELNESDHYDLFVETKTTLFHCNIKKTDPRNENQINYEDNYRI